VDDATILLVEDNPDDVELTMIAFRKAEISNPLVVARDGIEAQEYLFAQGSHAHRDPAAMPGLVLLDLKMPRLGGIDFLRSMREHPATRLIPVVVFTTSNEAGDITASYRAGANSYIRKPVDFTEFTEVARLVKAYWLGLNMAPAAEWPY
jgi:two-component system response regulator